MIFNVQVWVCEAEVVELLLEGGVGPRPPPQLEDPEQGAAGAGEGCAARVEDEVEGAVLVLVGKLDGCLAQAGRRVVLTADVAVSDGQTHVTSIDQISLLLANRLLT